MHYASTSRSDSDVFGRDDDLAPTANKGLLIFAGETCRYEKVVSDLTLTPST